MTESKPISSEAKVPYQVVFTPITFTQAKADSLLQEEINKFTPEYRNTIIPLLDNNWRQGGRNTSTITDADLDKAMAYVTAKELKPGDTIAVKDGTVSYDDLMKVSRDVENVSTKDATFSDAPKIYVIPEPPKENSKERFILDNLNLPKYKTMSANVISFGYNDSVVMNQVFIDASSADQIKATFAHEYGHRLDIATRGFGKAIYNTNAHAEMLSGDKIGEACSNSLIAGEVPLNIDKPTNENDKNCAEAIKPMQSDFSNAIRTIDQKNNVLSKEREVIADQYAVLAGYGDGLSNTLGGELGINAPTHPLRSERIAAIKAIQDNPSEAKDKLEAALAGFKANVLSIEEAGYGNKTPTPAPTISEQQPSLHVY